jgi:hypothetical protein
MSKQQQQEVAIETEIQGYKKDIVNEQVRRQKFARAAVDMLTTVLVHGWGVTPVILMIHHRMLNLPCLPVRCVVDADPQRAADQHRAQGAGRV